MIKRKKCRMCESTNLKEVLNLGNHSLVNSYIKRRPKEKRAITTFKNTSVYQMWIDSNAENS